MTIATHLIKIKGIVKDDKKENEIRDYIREKINDEIERIYHPDLELFRINEDGTVEVWVYVSDLSTEKCMKRIVERWLKDHIKEEGIEIKNFEVEKLPNEKFFILIRC